MINDKKVENSIKFWGYSSGSQVKRKKENKIDKRKAE